MKPEKILDALDYLDDDLIEAADKLRSAPHQVRISPSRTLAAVACVCAAVAATLIFARFITPDISSDGADTDNTDGAVEAFGVTLDKIVIDESFANKSESIGYLCHNGRIYIPYREITHRDTSEVVGDKLGTITDVFAKKPYGDYYGELCGNMAYDVYTMKDYDEDFMLAVDVDGSYYIYVNDNGMTLETGADIFADRFKLADGYSSVMMGMSGSTSYTEPIAPVNHSTLDSFITALCNAPVVDRSKMESIMVLASLQFTHNSGVDINVYLYEGGYVCLDVGMFSNVCVKLDADVFLNHLGWLRTISFDPDSFSGYIPTPLGETYLFYHKIFTSSTYLYFFSDAYFYPEPGTFADKTALKVYYTNDFGDSVNTISLDLPSDFDTSYDSAKPIYVGTGGGSGECEIIVRLNYGEETVYISFNNYSWTDSILEFKYGGEVDKAFIEKEKAMDASRFHISELLEDITMPTTVLSPKEQTGLYRITDNGGYQMVVQFITDQADEALLAALGVGGGHNNAFGNIDTVKINIVSRDECKLSDSYFVYTPSGAIGLTRDEVLHVLTLSGASIAAKPYYIIDEFGQSVEVTVHTYGGRVMPVSAEPYNLKVDGRYVFIPAEDNFRLNVYITPSGHPIGMDAVYVPLTATLEALGYTVNGENGAIIAEGTLTYTQSPTRQIMY